MISANLWPIQPRGRRELELTRPISLLEAMEPSLSASQNLLLTLRNRGIPSLVLLHLRALGCLWLFAVFGCSILVVFLELQRTCIRRLCLLEMAVAHTDERRASAFTTPVRDDASG